MPTIDANASKLAILEMVRKAGSFKAVTGFQKSQLERLEKSKLVRRVDKHLFACTEAGVTMLVDAKEGKR